MRGGGGRISSFSWDLMSCDSGKTFCHQFPVHRMTSHDVAWNAEKNCLKGKMWYKRHVFRFLTTSFLFILFRPRRETRAVFYPRRVHFFCVMICQPLHEASDGVINGAAFRQCYTVCCTCGPLKVYGQETKSRTRCQSSKDIGRHIAWF